MRRRRLGRTELEVPAIGFGCGVAAGLLINGSPEARREAVRRALDLGIDYFDTAPAYGGGRSETNLGEVLAALGARPIVATKVVLEIGDVHDIAGAVVRSVEASLARLKLTRLPIVQLHNRVGAKRAARGVIGSGAVLAVDDVLGAGGVVQGLAALRRRGLVDWFGCCAYGGEAEAIERLIDSAAFDTMLLNYSMLNTTAWTAPPPGAHVRDYGRVGARAAAAGMGTIALRVIEGGALSEDGPHPLSGGVGSVDYDDMLRRAACVRSQITSFEEPLAETAIRFALANDAISTVLIGFSDLAQIDAAAAATRRGPLAVRSLAEIEVLRFHDFGLMEP